MIEISEIKNRQTLKQWLYQRPQERAEEQEALRDFSLCLANRVSLRVLPIVLSKLNPIKTEFIVVTMRCLLTSGVGRKHQTQEIRKAAAAAALVASESAFTLAASKVSGAAATAHVSSASSAGALAVSSTIGNSLLGAHSIIAQNNASFMNLLWETVRLDCELLENEEQRDEAVIWLVEDPFQNVWATLRDWMLDQYDDTTEVRARAAKEGVDYRFWVDWYDAAMAGKHLNWDMQHEIALIADDVWTGDASVLMDRINGIRNKYAAAEIRNGERLSRNAKTGLIEAEVVSDVPENLLDEAKERMADVGQDMSVALVGKSSNQYTYFKDDPDRITDYLKRYGTRPMRLYEICVDLKVGVDDAIAKGECPKGDRFLEEYRRGLDRCAVDILVAEPDLRKRLGGRAANRARELLERDEARVRKLTQTITSEMVPELAEDMVRDQDVLLNKDSTDSERAHAANWYGGRAVQTAELKRKEIVKAGDDASKVAKGLDALHDGYQLVFDTIARWFL